MESQTGVVTRQWTGVSLMHGYAIHEVTVT